MRCILTERDALRDELAGLPTRVLMDLFHLMYRIKCRSGHPRRAEFFRAFRDLLLVPNRHDLRQIDRFLSRMAQERRSQGKGRYSRGETAEQAKQFAPRWYRRRVRHIVRGPAVLEPVIVKLFDTYRDLPDDNDVPLFTITDRTKETGILSEIRSGAVSDPAGFAPYIILGHDCDGLVVYRCFRGSSDLEGLHHLMIMRFSAFNCSALTWNKWASAFRISVQFGSGHFNRYGTAWTNHNCVTELNNTDNIWRLVWNVSAYTNFVNGTLYQQTEEHFGLQPNSKDLLSRFNMEQCEHIRSYFRNSNALSLRTSLHL